MVSPMVSHMVHVMRPYSRALRLRPRKLHLALVVGVFLLLVVAPNLAVPKCTSEEDAGHLCVQYMLKISSITPRSGVAAGSYTMTSPQSTMFGLHFDVSSSPSVLLGTVTSSGL